MQQSDLRLPGDLAFCQQIIEYSPSTLIITDGAQSDFRITYVNAAFERETGYARQDVIGKNLRFLQGDDTEQPALTEIHAALAEGRSCTALLRHYRKDGGMFWNELRLAPIYDAHGDLTHYIGVQNDVTERIRMQEPYETIVTDAVEGIAITQDWQTKFANGAIERLTGYPIEEYLALPIEQLIHPDYQKQIKDQYTHYMTEHEGPEKIVFRSVRKDGSLWWCETYITLIEYEGRLAIQNIFLDVTEREEAQQQLRMTSANLRALLNSAKQSFLLIDRDARIIEFDQRSVANALDIFGEHLYRGADVYKFVLEDEKEGFSQDYQRALRGETITSERIHRGQNRTYHFEVTLYPVTNEAGEILGACLSADDITERKQMEEQLRESEKQYRNLFENMMHEVHLWKLVRDEQGAIKTWQLVEANPAALKAWGKNHPDIIGKTPDEIFLHNATEQFMPIVKKIFSEGTPYTWETYFPPTDAFLYMTSVPFGEYFMSTGTDITERKQMEEKLRASEEKFRALVENIPDTVQRLTREGVHLYVNPLFAQMMGMSQADIIGKSNEELGLPPDLIKRLDDLRETAYTSKQAVDLDFDFAISGETRHLYTRLVPELDEQGNVVSLLGITRDITERKQAEAALKQKHEELDRFFTVALDLLCIADTDGNFIKLNREWENTLGYSIDKLEGQRFLDFVHPDDLQPTLSTIAQLDNQETVLNFTNRYRTHSGDYRYIEWRSYPHGKLIYASARDITERKQLEDALRESEHKYRSLAENAADGLVIWDALQKRMVYTSSGYDRQLGLSPGEGVTLTESDVYEMVHPDDRDVMFDQLRKAIEQQLHNTAYTIRRQHREGHYIWQENHATLEYDSEGVFQKAYVVSRDITKRKQAEERELELKLERERRKLLVTFFENAAHEFRTPLATINSSAYLMSRSDDPQRRKQKAGQIEAQIQRITKLVHRLLLMTRLESNEAFARRPVDAGEILQLVCMNAKEACAKNHNLLVEIQPDLPPVMGDADYLSDALQQIVDNACQFTPEGEQIIVKAKNDNERISIEIHDRGAGIPQENLPHIFETFWRQDTAGSTPGFGLGLPIAQKIVEQHDGSIQVESKPQEGAKFIVHLPTIRNV